ncbi:MAG: hypothetical protein KDH96_08535, partial [Candidatus Riesia sp.]|nr:hypothetical protein [Candidatus Riesia sp.]
PLYNDGLLIPNSVLDRYAECREKAQSIIELNMYEQYLTYVYNSVYFNISNSEVVKAQFHGNEAELAQLLKNFKDDWEVYRSSTNLASFITEELDSNLRFRPY